MHRVTRYLPHESQGHLLRVVLIYISPSLVNYVPGEAPVPGKLRKELDGGCGTVAR